MENDAWRDMEMFVAIPLAIISMKNPTSNFRFATIFTNWTFSTASHTGCVPLQKSLTKFSISLLSISGSTLLTIRINTEYCKLLSKH